MRLRLGFARAASRVRNTGAAWAAGYFAPMPSRKKSPSCSPNGLAIWVW